MTQTKKWPGGSAIPTEPRPSTPLEGMEMDRFIHTPGCPAEASGAIVTAPTREEILYAYRQWLYMEGRLLGVALAVVRREVLGGELLAQRQQGVVRRAVVLGEARPLAETLDVEPLEEHELEVAGGEDHRGSTGGHEQTVSGQTNAPSARDGRGARDRGATGGSPDHG